MFKRVLMIFILGVTIAVLQGSVVEAHLAGTTYTPTYRHISSYDCTGTFVGVPSLEIHPAFFRCSALVKEFEVLCANPTGKINFGNSGPRLVVQEAGGLIEETDITDKEKGKAQKTLTLPDTVLGAADVVCKERNRNWRGVDEFVTVVDVTIGSFDCADENCSEKEQAFEALLHCTRPINPANDQAYTLDPRENNPPPPPCDPDTPECRALTNWPTPYPCTLVSEAHCDVGDPCTLSN